MSGESLIGKRCEYKDKREPIWDESDCLCEEYEKSKGYRCACGDWHEMARPMAREMMLKSKPAKKPAPAKWEPIPAGTKQTKAQLIALANKLGEENARLKARLAKGGR